MIQGITSILVTLTQEFGPAETSPVLDCGYLPGRCDRMANCLRWRSLSRSPTSTCGVYTHVLAGQMQADAG